MEEIAVTRYWMALVLVVMALYVGIGFIGMIAKRRRERQVGRRIEEWQR